MKRLEPAFDATTKPWSAQLNVSQTDIDILENTIAEKSSELNFRLTEVLELYNIQTRQAEKLQSAHEEIDRLKQTISELTVKNDEVGRLERDRAAFSKKHDFALLETETLTVRLNAMQTALDTEKENRASALAQVDHLRFELAAATVERFKLVATVYGGKRRGL
jgi:chromosome segregation ATPase